VNRTFLAVQVPFEDRDLMPERQDLSVLVSVFIGSSCSSASVLVTPRYAGRAIQPVMPGARAR
jgi:hypothetical protein